MSLAAGILYIKILAYPASWWESKLAVVRADFIKNQQVQAVLDLQIIAQRSFSYVHAAQQVDTRNH